MYELLLNCKLQLKLQQSQSTTNDHCYDPNENINDGENDHFRRPAAIHQLDQQTYGLLIVAKTRPTARFLSNTFGERSKSLVKRYRAIVHGHFDTTADNDDGDVGRGGCYSLATFTVFFIRSP